jgi:hypothetical protein
MYRPSLTLPLDGVVVLLMLVVVIKEVEDDEKDKDGISKTKST